MKVAKLQHNTSLFHSKKRHNTFRKVRLPVLFGTIVSFIISLWYESTCYGAFFYSYVGLWLEVH